MLTYANKMLKLDAALTNGTDEAAQNPDGNLCGVVRFALAPVRDEGIRICGSFAYSDDSDASGASGTESRYVAFTAEASAALSSQLYVRGYAGKSEYDDMIESTKDGVLIWMAEAGFNPGRVTLAGRVSGWVPEDDDANLRGISEFIPNPGYGIGVNDAMVVTDQAVMRLQAAIGYQFRETLSLSTEVFLDDYDAQSGGQCTDVIGGLLVLRSSF